MKALKACHAKHNKRKRKACEAQAQRRYGTPHKAKKKKGGANRASSKRRVSR
jgi:hypothetical protein